MPAAAETCSSCGHIIAPAETAYLHDNKVVCAHCAAHLRSAQTPESAAWQAWGSAGAPMAILGIIIVLAAAVTAIVGLVEWDSNEDIALAYLLSALIIGLVGVILYKIGAALRATARWKRS